MKIPALIQVVNLLIFISHLDSVSVRPAVGTWWDSDGKLSILAPLATVRGPHAQNTNCLIRKFVLVREGHALTALPYKEIHILCARAAQSPASGVGQWQNIYNGLGWLQNHTPSCLNTTWVLKTRVNGSWHELNDVLTGLLAQD